MNLKGKYIIDSHLLYFDMFQLGNLQNCLVQLPYSQYMIFLKLVEKTLQSDKYTDEEKAQFSSMYKPFIDLIKSNKPAIDQMIDNEEFESPAICLNTIDALFLNFTNKNIPIKLDLPQEAREELSVFQYEILNTSYVLKSPIFTTNEELIALIKKYNIPVTYFVITK